MGDYYKASEIDVLLEGKEDAFDFLDTLDDLVKVLITDGRLNEWGEKIFMATISDLYTHLNTLTKKWFYTKSEIKNSNWLNRQYSTLKYRFSCQ